MAVKTNADMREVDTLQLICTNNRECCQLWALHQPPRELPASSMQAGAEKAPTAKLEVLECGA
jgi:hypothetical protein